MNPGNELSQQDQRAKDLHARAIVVDAACPLVTAKAIPKHLCALREGGVTCAFSTVASIEQARHALDSLAAWYARAHELSDVLMLAMRASDIELAKRQGRLAVVLHFQGGTPLEYNSDLVEAFYRLGVRVIQLTYNERNPLGDGCTERVDLGFRNIIKQNMAEMNRLGMIVDLSHVGYRTSMEAIEACRAPMICSHSNARTLHDSPRNVPDDLLRAIAKHDGVVGVCAFPAFLTEGTATIDQLIEQIDYLSRLIGPEHIGLGFDFSEETAEDYVYFRYDPRVYPQPPWTYPAGISGFRETPNITRHLVARGYSDQDILNILGGNFLRLFRRVCG
jgi:membrane dipeptidase